MVVLEVHDSTTTLPSLWESTDDPDLFHSVADLFDLCSTDSGWQVIDREGTAVARAATHALHPTTVHVGEWMLYDGGEWKCTDLRFVHRPLQTSRENPITLDELGFDYFLRHKPTKPIWFVDPITGETVHSGSKRMRYDEAPGVRYCPLCRCCISSNNYVTQHMRILHPEQPVPGELMTEFIRRSCLE